MILHEKLGELRVLYVEDDDITREMAHRMLSKYFKEVTAAPNGKEGFDKYNEIKPDLIVTDLSMPIMSGFEMIEAIRATDKDIPIIVTTAYRSEAESLKEVSGVVFKPVNKKILIQTISDLYN